MKIAIIGRGALGQYFASRLEDGGHDVTILTRQDTEISPETEIVIVTTKGWQVGPVLEKLAPIPADTPIMTTQNGVDAPVAARAACPDNPVVATTCVVVAERGEDGLILHGDEARVNMGEFDEQTPASAVEKIIEAFSTTPVTCIHEPDIHRALWMKLSLMASVGGCGALGISSERGDDGEFGTMDVGTAREHPEMRELIRAGITEVASVARGNGVAFSPADEEDVYRIFTEIFAPTTTSSLQRDLAAGRPSELSDLNGAVVAYGKKAGVPTPINSTVFATQLVRERAARAATDEPQV